MKRKCDPCIFLGLAITAITAVSILVDSYRVPFCTWYSVESCNGRSLFELLYFLTGGPLLFIVGLRALRQIRVGQDGLKQARDMEERRLGLVDVEARLALIAEFNSEILNSASEAWSELSKFCEHEITVESEGSTFKSKYPADLRTEAAGNQDLYGAIRKSANVLNRAEHFALSVQVLDQQSQQAIYEVCGVAYVNVLRNILSVTVHFGPLTQCIPAVRLYREWGERVEQDKRSAANALITVTCGSSISEYVYDLDTLLGNKKN